MTRIPLNHHWVKFEFKDWLIDGAIRSCDAATRGIYMDLFCLAMTSKKTGVLTLNDKQICKQLAIKPLQFERVIKNLIAVKLCSRGRDNELILTQIVDDIDIKDAEIVPNRTDMEPNRCRTGKENVENPPKIDPPIKEKNRNRIDISTNVDIIPPKSPQSIGEPSDDSKSILFNESLILLSQIAKLSEEKCRPLVGRWLEQLDGKADMLVSMIDKGMMANAPIPYISKMVANAVKVAGHGGNVTPFCPRKTNKQQMTETWGLCHNAAEFVQRFGDEEPTLEQLQSHNPNRAWGA